MSYQSANTITKSLADGRAIEALKRLPRILAREGYPDVYTLYGPLNARNDAWRRDLHLLPETLQTLFKLFLLGLEVPVQSLKKILAEWEIEALTELSILLPGARGVHTGSLALISAYGYFVFAQRPTVDPIVYFGEDSAAFAAHLMPAPGGLCLDLCAGPGTQSLLCSSRAGRVVAVEINPVAASHAELNVVMNDREDKIEVRLGDLYAAVEGLQFDYICANPPLLPFPPSLPYPFIGHGGSDGLDVTRRILNGISKALKPDGVCQIIGSCLGNDEGPLCEEELRNLAIENSWNVRMIVPSALALRRSSTMFEGLAWTCATAAGLPLEQVTTIFEAHLAEIGATQLDLFFLIISKGAEPDFSMTKHYRERSGFWFI
jgi:methylase of polypeptide subunit release factors